MGGNAKLGGWHCRENKVGCRKNKVGKVTLPKMQSWKNPIAEDAKLEIRVAKLEIQKQVCFRLSDETSNFAFPVPTLRFFQRGFSNFVFSAMPLFQLCIPDFQLCVPDFQLCG